LPVQRVPARRVPRAGASLEMAAPRFAQMRRRVREFLDEIGVDPPMPVRHAVYQASYIRLFETMQG